MSYLGQFLQMVNVHIPSSHSIVCVPELKTAHEAFRPIVFDALLTGRSIPFIRVNKDVSNGSFEIGFGLNYLIGENGTRRKALTCLNCDPQPSLIICLGGGMIWNGLIGLVTQSVRW